MLIRRAYTGGRSTGTYTLVIISRLMRLFPPLSLPYGMASYIPPCRNYGDWLLARPRGSWIARAILAMWKSTAFILTSSFLDRVDTNIEDLTSDNAAAKYISGIRL